MTTYNNILLDLIIFSLLSFSYGLRDEEEKYENDINKVNICNSCSADDRNCSRKITVPCEGYNSLYDLGAIHGFESKRKPYVGYGYDETHKYQDYNSYRQKRDDYSGEIKRGWKMTRSGDYSGERRKRGWRWKQPRRRWKWIDRHQGYKTDYYYDSNTEATDQCTDIETYTCRYFKCYDVCCTGWLMEPINKTCTVYDTNPVNIICKNGGKEIVTTEGPVCVCPASYTGRNCDTNLCDLNCKNEGLCDFVDGASRCICQEGFEGTLCEKPICVGGCKNQGQCVSANNLLVEPTCVCTDNYSGKNCEIAYHKPKPGVCPEIYSDMMVNAGVCTDSCYDDSGCHGDHKCCSTGCGTSCMMPTDNFCLYNGTRYPIGQNFRPTACIVCTCYDPDKSKVYGGARCDFIPCPGLEYCLTIEEGECCGICIDHLLVPEQTVYKEPRFINCPSKTLEVVLALDETSVDLPINLIPKDYQNKQLDVLYSRTTFPAGKGPKNYHTVTATSSPDAAGKHALCIFQIKVKDRQPPTFDYCPSDIKTIGHVVSWNVPVARDNVGLGIKPVSRSKPGQRFSTGDHAIVYKTEDYEGNVAMCIFFVKVKPNKESTKLKTHTQSPPVVMHLYIIGLCAFGAAVLAVISIAFICYKTKRETNGEPILQTSSMSTLPSVPRASQNIYTVSPSREPPPSYDNINKLRLSPSKARELKLVETGYFQHPVSSRRNKPIGGADESTTSLCNHLFTSSCRYGSNPIYQTTSDT